MMECKFVVGQKVVCIDNKGYRGAPIPNNYGLTEGVVYTIKDIYSVDKEYRYYSSTYDRMLHVRKGVHIVLNEITRSNTPEKGFMAYRFKPLQETSIDKFIEMCNTQYTPIKELV